MKTLLASVGLFLGLALAAPVDSQAQCTKSDKAKASAQCDNKEMAKASAECDKKDMAKASAECDYSKTAFKVNGNCGQCQERIETAAASVKGVKKAHWDKESHKLALAYADGQAAKKKTINEKVAKAIAKAGHDTEKINATSKAYAALPNCCKYREN